MEVEAKSLHAPSLYIYGTASDDFMSMIRLNLSFFEKYLPNVKVVAIQDGIHDSAFQKPDEVARLIKAFLAEGSPTNRAADGGVSAASQTGSAPEVCSTPSIEP